jgi:hypothetical protein
MDPSCPAELRPASGNPPWRPSHDHAAADHVDPDQVDPDQVDPDHVDPDHVDPDHVDPDHRLPDHRLPDHRLPDHAGLDQDPPERTIDPSPFDRRYFCTSFSGFLVFTARSRSINPAPWAWASASRKAFALSIRITFTWSGVSSGNRLSRIAAAPETIAAA